MEFAEFQREYALALDPQQAAAVQAVEGPVLLLAVPGSGKTTVLVSRIGYMRFVRGIPAEKILTMTYTVAAAGDMRRRFAALFGAEAAEGLEFRTINGVCSRIIRLYERRLGRTAFRLLEAAEQAALLGELYRQRAGEFAPEGTVKALGAAITYVKNQMLGEEQLSEVNVEGVDFPPFYRAYCISLRERRCMDYDDQMVYALEILRRYPQILRESQDRYQYFCVDEAQDTSKIQHRIVHLLASRSKNIFMVGDEDQSIYGFRAAFPQALTGFDRLYPGAQILYLERNYRSNARIVEAADRFIQKNENRKPKHMVPTRPAGEPVREIQVYNRQKQYRYLETLARTCDRETAVLYRDNDSALPLIDLLDRSGTPYCCRQVEGSFFTNRVVRDICDMFRFAEDPGDGTLFLRFYYKLGAGISRLAAQEAVEQCGREGETILGYIAQLSSVSAWTRKQCKALETHFENLRTERADKAVYRIVHFMGYGAYLEERGMDAGKAELLEALGEQATHPRALLERLAELETVVRQGGSDGGAPLILSTIHSSKGLEYERVILMDVADGIFPKSLPDKAASQEEKDAYEEERRLFYVGMTRARESLAVITFRKDSLRSAFSRELFPEKKAPVPKPATIPARLTRPAQPDRGYGDGARVRHRQFGPGTILSRAGDIATISFDSGACKRVSVSTALRMGQLTREP